MIPGWRQPEVNHVRMWGPTVPAKTIARQISKPEHEVELVIKKLNIAPAPQPIVVPQKKTRGRPKFWNDARDARLIELWSVMNNAEIADLFGCSVTSVKARGSAMGLKRGRRKVITKNTWTPEQDEIVRTQYPHTHTADLVPILNRTHSAIANRAEFLGVKKTAEAISLTNSNSMRHRNYRIVGSLKAAREHIERGDNLTALELLDVEIKTYGGEK